jgi:hypothetical protein
LVVISPVLQPFQELLKQNLFLNGIDVAFSIRSNNLLVLGFDGKIGGVHGLDALENARHDECCDSNISQWIVLTLKPRRQCVRSRELANVSLTINFGN